MNETTVNAVETAVEEVANNAISVGKVVKNVVVGLTVFVAGFVTRGLVDKSKAKKAEDTEDIDDVAPVDVEATEVKDQESEEETNE